MKIIRIESKLLTEWFTEGYKSNLQVIEGLAKGCTLVRIHQMIILVGEPVVELTFMEPDETYDKLGPVQDLEVKVKHLADREV